MTIWDDHDVLYHYTTLAGLKGILETQTLHATHFAFLNDSKELYQIKPRLLETVIPITSDLYLGIAATSSIVKQKIDKRGGIASVASHDASELINVLYDVTLGHDRRLTFYRPFTVSFCGHEQDYERENGLLSQWRAYGRDSGYAIAFDTKGLVDLLEGELDAYRYSFAGFVSVIYDEGADAFKREFNDLIEAMKRDLTLYITEDEEPSEELFDTFRWSLPRYKHRGFFEEQEVRIIVSPIDERLFAGVEARGDKREEKAIRFRDTLAPYVVLFDKPKKALPIKRIIVGPHADKERRMDKLRNYLHVSGLEIEVSCSETPLV